MSYKVLFKTEAESDLLDAAKYYEVKLEGLGTEIISSVETTLQSISHQTESYPIVYRNIRRALIRKFPFGIHYIIEESRIVVLVVFHFSRDSKNWKNRK